MKWLFLTTLFFNLSLQILYSQEPIADQRITASYNQATLKEIIEDLSEQYKIKFTYSTSLLPLKTKITFSCNELILSEALKQIFEGSNIGFKEIGNQIVLYPIEVINEYVVNGFVRDSVNGEGLIGVIVLSVNNNTGTTTNSEGYYSLKLNKGSHLLKISSMGYKPQYIKISVNENQTINTELAEESTFLNEVTVTTDLKSEKVISTLGGIEKVDIRALRKLPNLLGEPDIIRTLAFLPGISSNELSLGEFNIRGGATNQTLFQMDEAPIPQISHFGGVFSYYNPDVVKQVIVSKGNFTASEKGALSAVIDVKLREGNKKDWVMSGGVGTIFTRFMIEGPIKKDKTSIIIAGRKSYIDQLFKLFPNAIDGEPDLYQFNDFNVKIDHRFNWKNSLSIAAFYGNDILLQENNLSLNNLLGIIKWQHYFNQQLYLESKFIAGEHNLTEYTDVKPQVYTLEISQDNYQWHNNFNYYLNQRFKFKAGYQLNWQENIPFHFDKSSNESIVKNYSLNKTRILEQSIYAETEQIWLDRLAFNAGVRCTYFLHLGPGKSYNFAENETHLISATDTNDYSKNQIIYRYFSIEPRISLRYLLSVTSSVKASYTRGTNFVHRLPISTVTMPISRNMTSSSLFPPEKADNYSLGYYYNSNNNISAAIEVYYRKMTNMVENRQNNELLITDQPELYVREANGNAYGIELSTNGNLVRIDYMVSYSFAHARYKTSGINNNKSYAPLFDINHSVTAFANMKLGQRFEFGINWIFQSGLPYTEPAGIYLIDGRPVLQFNEDEINTKRLPPYHRMDISISFIPLKNAHRRWKNSWNFSIYNVYARKNPLGVTYYLENGEDIPEMKNADQWKPRYVYFYQFIPSISYNFKF